MSTSQARTALLAFALTFFAASDCTLNVSAADSKADAVVGQRLAEMFTAGFGRGSTALKSAQRLYDTARDQSRGDARVEYAYGLVLLKQIKTKEALAQFQAATKANQEYWPGWQALVWLHLVSKEYSEGYARMTDFAKRLAASDGDLAERQQAAEWIGSAIAALQKSVDTVKQREALLRQDETVKEILGEALGPSLARGKSSINTLHALMEEGVQLTREQQQAREAKEQAEREAQVAKDLEASAEKRETLKKTAEDTKKSLDEQLATIDKQLARLEKDYDFLQKRILSLTASQTQANLEYQLFNQASQNTNNNTNQDVNRQRRAMLEAQMIRYQVETDQTLAATMSVSQRAQVLVGQRQATVKQYERATGEILAQESSLNKWQERLKNDGEKLKEAPKGKSAPVANKIKQARSFRTYVNLDLPLERDRVLDSFGIALPDAEESLPPKP